jgi:hypothetical protein
MEKTMKKLFAVLIVTLSLSAGLSAQTQWPDINRYAELSAPVPNWLERRTPLYGDDPADHARFCRIEGDENTIDTPLELALLCYYSAAEAPYIPAEAEAILPHSNPGLVDRQLGALVQKELAVLRFLGNTAAAGRYEAILQVITSRGNVTRAEIESYYRQNIGKIISDVVDMEFKKPRNGYVPFDVYTRAGHGEVLIAIKDILTSFFVNPNNTNYLCIYAIFVQYNNQLRRGNIFAAEASSAVYVSIISLNPALAERLDKDRLTIPDSIANDPRVRAANVIVR